MLKFNDFKWCYRVKYKKCNGVKYFICYIVVARIKCKEMFEVISNIKLYKNVWGISIVEIVTTPVR